MSEVVLVTGGTHGIGRACVKKLTEDGFSVVFSGRDKVAGNELESSLCSAHFKKCDVTLDEDCISLARFALDQGEGKLAGLVNNAGMSLRSDFPETSLEDWDMIMSTNARSVYHMTRLCIEGLIAGGGNVVTTSSVAGMVGQKGLSLYTASKASLIGLTQALALELGERVRFNAICPGQIGTRMMQRVIDNKELLESTVANVPAGRLGSAEEIADVVAWLLSDKSSFVNGAIIPIDGGETAGILD